MQAVALTGVLLNMAVCSLYAEFVLKSAQKRKHKERAGREYKDGNALIAFRQDLKSKALTCADQLAHRADGNKTYRKSKPHSESVENRRNNLVFSGIAFRSAENDAVYYYKRNIESERIVK